MIYLSLSKAPPAGQEVAVNFGRKPRGIEYIGLGKSDKGFGLKEGERFVFNSDNWNQPAMAVIQLDPKLKSDTGGHLRHQFRQHPRRLVHHPVLRGRAVPGLQLLAQHHAAPPGQRRPGA